MIKDNYATDDDEYFIDESKSFKGIVSLRQETELFDDDDYVAHDFISVRRIELAKGEDWEIFKNDKKVLVLKGIRFSSKERKFLRTIHGVNFIICGYKQGWNSVSEFKRRIKKAIS